MTPKVRISCAEDLFAEAVVLVEAHSMSFGLPFLMSVLWSVYHQWHPRASRLAKQSWTLKLERDQDDASLDQALLL